MSGAATHAAPSPPPIALALAGGGTGGHVVPGLHLLAHGAQAGSPFGDVLWFVTGRRVEERVFASARDILARTPLERVALAMEPEGGGAPSLPRLMVRVLPEVARARSALARHGSRVLLGLGGFTELPAVLAARTLRIPVALLEINAAMGKATRWLAPLSARVFHAWPATVPAGAEPRHAWLGPPLSPAFLTGRPEEGERAAARAELGFEPARPLLAVLGGSQGALGLNRFVAAQAEHLAGHGLSLLHQVGPGRLAEAAAPAPGYRAVEYMERIERVLAAATLVLCRGGASTLAEIAARATPALVVPYPHHADRHQERNARSLGAGVRIVPEERLGRAVADEILALSSDAGAAEREAMSSALARAVPRDAGARLVAELLRLADPANN